MGHAISAYQTTEQMNPNPNRNPNPNSNPNPRHLELNAGVPTLGKIEDHVYH